MSEEQTLLAGPEQREPESDRVGARQTRLGVQWFGFVYSPDDFYYWRHRPIVLSGGHHHG